MLTGFLRHLLLRPVTAVAEAFARRGVEASHVTFAIPLLLWLLSVPLMGWFSMTWGAISAGLLLSLDAIDGTIARSTGHASPWGAFCDLLSDRLSDAAVWSGVLIGCYERHWVTAAAFVLIAAVVSQLQSYTAIAGASVGIAVPLGPFQRTERTALLLLAVVLAAADVPLALAAAAVIIIAGGLASIIARAWAIRTGLRTLVVDGSLSIDDVQHSSADLSEPSLVRVNGNT
jgi:CDP-diacylglycerol---glycerol-3-phosphate 3-phosphatidyltransferase